MSPTSPLVSSDVCGVPAAMLSLLENAAPCSTRAAVREVCSVTAGAIRGWAARSEGGAHAHGSVTKTASGAGRRSGRWRVRTAGCGLRRSLGDSDEITLWTWDRSVSDELVARAETKGIP
jgi:hypothetical protein